MPDVLIRHSAQIWLTLPVINTPEDELYAALGFDQIYRIAVAYPCVLGPI